MVTGRRRSRGFTLVEMMVVLAIVGVLAALGAVGLSRVKPRANLATTATDLHAMIRNARQNAMLTGVPTLVLLFPQYVNPAGGRGRVVVLQDVPGTFFTASAPTNFVAYVPGSERSLSDVGFAEGMTDFVDLPQRVEFGLDTGAGGTMPAPYDRITIAGCSFCGGSDGRGAIRFDSRGRATFHNANGAPLDLFGASFSIHVVTDVASTTSTDQGTRTLVLTSASGAVRTFTRG